MVLQPHGRGWGQVEPSSFYSRCHPNSWSNSSFSSVEIACLGTLWFPVSSSQHQKAGEQMWRQRVSNPFLASDFSGSQSCILPSLLCFLFPSSTLLGPVISWCPLLLSIIRQEDSGPLCQRQNWDPTSFLAHWIRSHSTKSVLFMFSGSNLTYWLWILAKEKINSEHFFQVTQNKETEHTMEYDAIKKWVFRTFLAVQGLRLCAPNAAGASLFPGRGTKNPHAV